MIINTFKDFHEFLNQPVSYSFFSYANELHKANNCYHELLVGKKSGGTRTLQVPSKKLKWLQRQLLPFLCCGVVSSCAFAYRKSCGVLDNATPHVGKKLLVKLDIENFFGSIRFSQVFHAIDLALAASPSVGTGCSNKPLITNRSSNASNSLNYNSELSWYFAKICTLHGVLPQGAPTSPILSNMVFFPLDNIIYSYCQKHGITYTRYSDDMTFSGDFSPSMLISFVRKLLSENGFNLNADKTTIVGRGKRHLVTGVCVNQRVQAQRIYRHKIRQEMYFIGKYGISGHLENCPQALTSIFDKQPSEISAQLKKLRQMLGQINYVLHLDPSNSEFLSYKQDCVHLLELIPQISRL